MRDEEETSEMVDDAYLVKAPTSRERGKFCWCDNCKKHGHDEKDCWHKGKLHL